MSVGQPSSCDPRATSLEKDDVTPDARGVAADLFLDADPAKPDALMEGQAGGVVGLDAGDQRPDAGPLRLGDQRLEERTPDTAATRARVDIDTLPGDARIDLARRVAGDGRPTGDAPGEAGNETAIAPM